MGGLALIHLGLLIVVVIIAAILVAPPYFAYGVGDMSMSQPGTPSATHAPGEGKGPSEGHKKGKPLTLTKDTEGNWIMTAKDSTGNIIVQATLPKDTSEDMVAGSVGFFAGYYFTVTGSAADLEKVVQSFSRPLENIPNITRAGFLLGVQDGLQTLETRTKLIKDTLEAFGARVPR